MKIVFKNSYDERIEIPVINIAYEVDENGRPIDIFVFGVKESIDQIAEQHEIGFNYREVESYEVPYHNKEYLEAVANGESVWMCLCARLPKFEIEGNHQSIFA